MPWRSKATARRSARRCSSCAFHCARLPPLPCTKTTGTPPEPPSFTRNVPCGPFTESPEAGAKCAQAAAIASAAPAAIDRSLGGISELGKPDLLCLAGSRGEQVGRLDGLLEPESSERGGIVEKLRGVLGHPLRQVQVRLVVDEDETRFLLEEQVDLALDEKARRVAEEERRFGEAAGRGGRAGEELRADEAPCEPFDLAVAFGRELPVGGGPSGGAGEIGAVLGDRLHRLVHRGADSDRGVGSGGALAFAARHVLRCGVLRRSGGSGPAQRQRLL